jgi:hypothetical protein
MASLQSHVTIVCWVVSLCRFINEYQRATWAYCKGTGSKQQLALWGRAESL